VQAGNEAALQKKCHIENFPIGIVAEVCGAYKYCRHLLVKLTVLSSERLLAKFR